MTITPVKGFSGLKVANYDAHKDSRGVLMPFSDRDLGITFVQENLVISKQNTVRGLHFAVPPNKVTKFVTCVDGTILDAVVDVRKNSKSFGKVFTMKLFRPWGLLIPNGYAHGYAVLTEQAIVYYRVSDYYEFGKEEAIHWDDPTLKIAWGVPPKKAIVSDRDSMGVYFDLYFERKKPNAIKN